MRTCLLDKSESESEPRPACLIEDTVATTNGFVTAANENCRKANCRTANRRNAAGKFGLQLSPMGIPVMSMSRHTVAEIAAAEIALCAIPNEFRRSIER